MNRVLPPLCLILALAMLISGFAMLAFGAPEASVEYHRALTAGDEDQADVFKVNLVRRQFARRVLLGSLFGGSVVLVVAAFLLMRPASG